LRKKEQIVYDFRTMKESGSNVVAGKEKNQSQKMFHARKKKGVRGFYNLKTSLFLGNIIIISGLFFIFGNVATWTVFFLF